MKRNTDNMEIKRRSTFAILFYINRTKIRKDGTCQLLCKISIDAKWEQIGTKVSVNPAVWNPEKGRADGRSENAITVNRAIDDLTKEIKEHYRRIKNSLGFITAEQVKNAVMGVGQKPLTLLALFREHNEEFKKRIGVDRIKESYDSYLRSYKHLSAFVQEKRGIEDVLLRNLDRVFYDDFELFLRTNRNLSPKTVHEHLYRLKKMTMRAVSQGTIRRDPSCRPCGACRKPSARFPCCLSLWCPYPVQFSVRLSLFRSLLRLASIPKWMLNMRRLKQTGELYSIRCHSVKWLPENDHLKYPDSEPNCGLVFLFIRNLFTSTMCLAVRRMFRISTNAICE